MEGAFGWMEAMDGSERGMGRVCVRGKEWGTIEFVLSFTFFTLLALFLVICHSSLRFASAFKQQTYLSINFHSFTTMTSLLINHNK